MNTGYLLLILFPLVICTMVLGFPTKYEKSLYWFLSGLAVIFFVVCLMLNRKFPELEVETEVPVMAFLNILLITCGWIFTKRLSLRSEMRNKPFLYQPIIFGLGLIIVGCFALTYMEFFDAPFLHCSFGLIFTSFGIRLWRKNKILSNQKPEQELNGTR